MKRFWAVVVLLAIGLFGIAGWREAQQMPLVRETRVRLPGWPAGARPVRLVLISDVHVSRPDMPPSRLADIVARINRLEPDVVVIAGDLTSDKPSAIRVETGEALAPLRGLRTPLGVFAVYGNHDHDRGIAETRRALVRAGVRPLVNEAVRIGPIALGGADDAATGHENLELTLARMRALGGPMVLVDHAPTLFKFLPPDVGLMLAGHTHCGQINIPPWLDDRLACGIVRKGRRQLIVTAGLGTSIIPLRFRAPPDLWLITIGG